MRLKFTNKKLRKSLVSKRKQIKVGAIKAEKDFEKYFLHRLGRIERVGRFVFGWILLMALLIGGLFAQNLLLSSYYQTVKPVPGGIYKEGMLGSFTNANPVYAVGEVDSSVSKLLFAGLFNYDQAGNVVGDLAESFTIDSHSTTYTIKLRPNLKWHDGKPLTSADVVYTYKTIQNPDIKSPLVSSWQGVVISATDDKTVVFKLPTPLSSFMYSLTTGIIPEHVLKDVPIAEFRSADFNTIEPVGAGPFEWSAIEVTGTDITNSEQQIAMSAFDDYHSGPPKLQEFVVHTYTDKDRLIKGLESKQLTAISGLYETPKSLANDADIREKNFILRAATMVFFKTTSGILADQKVRSALVQSSDTTQVAQSLGYETRLVKEPLLTGQVGFSAKFAQANFDLNAAKTALTANGWIEGKDGIREKAGAKLKFELTAENTPEYQRVSKVLKKQWRSVGVDVKVTLLDPAEFNLNLSSHTYEALLYGISIGVDPDVFVYWSSTQADIRSTHRLNLSEYNSPVADRALESGRSRSDPALKAIKYQPFLQAWQKDAPALALYQPRFLYLTNGPVDGLDAPVITTPIDRYVNVHNWQIRQAKVTNP